MVAHVIHRNMKKRKNLEELDLQEQKDEEKNGKRWDNWASYDCYWRRTVAQYLDTNIPANQLNRDPKARETKRSEP